jgi:hypothetical protein
MYIFHVVFAHAGKVSAYVLQSPAATCHYPVSLQARAMTYLMDSSMLLYYLQSTFDRWDNIEGL